MPLSKISFVRLTVLAILVGVAALAVIVAFNLWLVRQAGVYSDAVNKDRAQRAAIVDLRNTIEDAEAGQRGYLLTGDPTYLKPYLTARQELPEEIDRIRTLMANEPAQKAEVDRLTPVVTNKLAELQHIIDVYDGGRPDDALAAVKTNRGLILMGDARNLLATLLQQAENNTIKAVQDQRESILTLQWITIGGALVIILVVGGSVWAVLSYTRQLIQAQQEVQALNSGLEDRVRERTGELGRANEEIQRFAYMVTHDLRAPLVNIMGFTSELDGCLASIQNYVRGADETSEDPSVKEARTAAFEDLPEAIGFIRSSTRKMDGLINAILRLSREGRRVLKPEPIQLDALLKTVTENVRHQMIESGGDVEIKAQVPTLVSDRLALEQIFGNLLDNAVKYRMPDRPLKILIRATQGLGQRVVVEVQDNGRGIAKQDHDRVFDLFRRSGKQDRPGEGIGLAHVRTMARNLGGEITLQSELAQGTIIKLDLPRDLRVITSTQTGAA
jgi:signal transduction histidine kinase